jgi:hypothetical protein
MLGLLMVRVDLKKDKATSSAQLNTFYEQTFSTIAADVGNVKRKNN